MRKSMMRGAAVTVAALALLAGSASVASAGEYSDETDIVIENTNNNTNTNSNTNTNTATATATVDEEIIDAAAAGAADAAAADAGAAGIVSGLLSGLGL